MRAFPPKIRPLPFCCSWSARAWRTRPPPCCWRPPPPTRWGSAPATGWTVGLCCCRPRRWRQLFGIAKKTCCCCYRGRRCSRVLKTWQQTLCNGSIRTLCPPSITMIYLWHTACCCCFCCFSRGRRCFNPDSIPSHRFYSNTMSFQKHLFKVYSYILGAERDIFAKVCDLSDQPVFLRSNTSCLKPSSNLAYFCCCCYCCCCYRGRMCFHVLRTWQHSFRTFLIGHCEPEKHLLKAELQKYGRSLRKCVARLIA